jgi:polysaccharide export outer membrane protein
MVGKFLRAAAIAIAFAAAAGGAAPGVPGDEASLAGDGYRLGSGDKLRITVYNEPTLTGEFGITPSGNISFPLIGEVVAKGMTIEAVRDAIREKLAAGYVNDPRVTVETTNYRPFYVLGEVNKPGEYPYTVGLRIEQAIATAGGYTYRANRGKAFLRRADAAERTIKVRKEPFHILPGDTIRIGERYF